MVVVGENYSFEEPSLEFCKGYAKSMKVPVERFYLDWSESGGAWETLFANIDPYVTGSSFAVPWDIVLDGQNLEYLYTSSTDPYPGMGVKQALYDAMYD